MEIFHLTDFLKITTVPVHILSTIYNIYIIDIIIYQSVHYEACSKLSGLSDCICIHSDIDQNLESQRSPGSREVSQKKWHRTALSNLPST